MEKSQLDSFYYELQERHKYIETTNDYDDNEKKIRLNEVTLAIVRIQQILLEDLNKKNVKKK
jgi:hypothetical protein